MLKHRTMRYGPGREEYRSEFTNFMDGYLREHPEVVDDQRHGWYIWWDHDVDLAEEQKARRDSVPLPPYYYE